MARISKKSTPFVYSIPYYYSITLNVYLSPRLFGSLEYLKDNFLKNVIVLLKYIYEFPATNLKNSFILAFFKNLVTPTHKNQNKICTGWKRKAWEKKKKTELSKSLRDFQINS